MNDLPKNYRINFMDGEHIYITAQQAAQISAAWMGGNKCFLFQGEAHAFHQVKNIKKLGKEECISKFKTLELPTMEQFFPATQPEPRLGPAAYQSKTLEV